MSAADEGKPTSTCSKAQPQPTKRRPDTDLNHDNWDQEDEPEEQGEFKKATEDELKDRKILTARRKQKSAAQPSTNPFGGVNLASAFSTKSNGNDTSQNQKNPVSMFNFASLAASAQAPKFDFSCITSTTSSTGEERPLHKIESNDQSPSKEVDSTSTSPEKVKEGTENEKSSEVGSEVVSVDSSNGDTTLDKEASLIMDSNSKPEDKESEDSSGLLSYNSDETGPGDDNSNSATKT